jgi:hypothetical protein
MKIKLLIALAMFSLTACTLSTETKSEDVDSSASSVTTAVDGVKSIVLPQSENDVTRKSFEAFAAGDMNGFSANWDDNVKIYYPGPGDSLMGKKAALEFFTERRSKYDSVTLFNPTFLAVKNNEPNSPVALGKWLMSWHTFIYKMKNSKTVVLPIHSVMHYNSTGKADIIALYYDMHRLMEAGK